MRKPAMLISAFAFEAFLSTPASAGNPARVKSTPAPR